MSKRPARTVCTRCGDPSVVHSGYCRQHWNQYMRAWRRGRTAELRAYRKAAGKPLYQFQRARDVWDGQP